jgi:hypothetical protein
MHDLSEILDGFHEVHRDLRLRYNRNGAVSPANDAADFAEIDRVSHDQASMLLEVLGGPSHIRDEDGERVRSHKFHRDFLLRSEFIRHALEKPSGYAGDKTLMEMIWDGGRRAAPDRYSFLKNRVYLDLPAAHAVRDRVVALGRHLVALPPKSRVLNLACGPAIEVRDNIGALEANGIHLTLLDHDINTLRDLYRQIPSPNARIALANALHFIKDRPTIATPRPGHLAAADPSRDFRGWRQLILPFRYRLDRLADGEFDFIYSAGLYDYIRTDPDRSKGASGLTRFLFAKLKKGGTLLVGNYLAGSPENPHRPHHRMMMEVYSEWRLLYRTREEILSFADALPRGAFATELLNERLEKSDLSDAVIGFVAIRKL